MARIIAERCHDTEHARRLWHFCCFASLSDIEKSSSAPVGTWNDNTLALTFASVMQGQTSAGQSLLGRPLLPSLFLREYYTGAQEDANMFIMNCLQLCPRTLQLFKGRHRRAELECNLCGHRDHCGEIGSAAEEQEFTSIQLETRHDDDTGMLITSVTTALSVSCKEPVDEKFKGRCTNVECGARWSFKIYPVERPPQVLLLQLKIWEYFDQNGCMRPRRLSCALHLEESITLADVDYTLQAIVYHSGDSPHAGHYAVVARHGDSFEPFFAYNDAHRQGVPRQSLACSMPLPGSWETVVFHVHALLYERSQ